MMAKGLASLTQRLIDWEPLLVTVLAWAAFVSIPLALGEIGISWDALNHQVYLGWTAEGPRFDQDFLAASYQSFQFPYLYWPLYRLSMTGLSGAWAGAVLATLYVTMVPPVWMMARTCMPGTTWFDMAMRFAAVALAFLTGAVLSLFDTTANDLLAAVPFVWAMALALEPLDGVPRSSRVSHRTVALSGFFAGAAIAFKLSNGPLAILLPALWMLSGDSLTSRLRHAALGCVATVAAYVAIYGYWGWQLWVHFGNPIYPFYDHLAAPARDALGWKP